MCYATSNFLADYFDLWKLTICVFQLHKPVQIGSGLEIKQYFRGGYFVNEQAVGKS